MSFSLTRNEVRLLFLQNLERALRKKNLPPPWGQGANPNWAWNEAEYTDAAEALIAGVGETLEISSAVELVEPAIAAIVADA